jgi:anti-sigma28 factor (negative regulator of flagellin synthesis)
MATLVEMAELQSTDRRKSQDAGNSQRRDASPNDDGLMEQILEDLSTMPQEEVLEKIASLPRTRQRKVLDIRRQLTEGTYKVPDRLDWAIDRVLEDCMFVFDAGCWHRTSHRMTMTCCTL